MPSVNLTQLYMDKCFPEPKDEPLLQKKGNTASEEQDVSVDRQPGQTKKGFAQIFKEAVEENVIA